MADWFLRPDKLPVNRQAGRREQAGERAVHVPGVRPPRLTALSPDGPRTAGDAVQDGVDPVRQPRYGLTLRVAGGGLAWPPVPVLGDRDPRQR